MREKAPTPETDRSYQLKIAPIYDEEHELGGYHLVGLKPEDETYLAMIQRVYNIIDDETGIVFWPVVDQAHRENVLAKARKILVQFNDRSIQEKIKQTYYSGQQLNKFYFS